MPTPSLKNPTTALENMVIARDVLARRGVPLVLAFGTLLGALREKDFIAHDTDVDVLILESNGAEFARAFADLEARGLTFLEKLEHPRVYSFQRNGEQIDFFVARPGRFGLLRRRGWDLDGRAVIPLRHLQRLETIQFHGERFHVPGDPYGVVRNLYGRTWHIPIADRPARISNLLRIKKALTHPLKAPFYARRFLAERLRWASAARGRPAPPR